MTSIVSDNDMERMKKIMRGITDLKLRVDPPEIKPRLADGLYYVHSRLKDAKWVLSIYRNVKVRENDIEIALDVWPLSWPLDDPRPARRWLSKQRTELQHRESGIHATKPADSFRIGLKLPETFTFLERLQQQLLLNGNARWSEPVAPVLSLTTTPLVQATPPQEQNRQLQEQALPPSAVPAPDVVGYMLRTVQQTCAQSGSTSVMIAKVKEWRFQSDEHFRQVVGELLAAGKGKCALTGVYLDESMADSDLAPSLDRIDSDGHYEPGNLQVVARFANRWKSDNTDQSFARLLALVRAQ